MTIQDEKKRWEEETLNPALNKFKERKDEFKTSSGIEVPRLALDPELASAMDTSQGFPGEYPFTRGVQPTMYRGRFWTMRQYAGYASAEESNARYRYLLDQGQTGLSVAFDLPTQIGYDADDPLAAGEVGKVGVSISSLKDMAQLFYEIPLEKVSTSMTINAPAAILLAMYIAVAKKQGADVSKLRGTIQNDILKEYVARGTYIYPPTPSMRLITDIFQYCQAEVPRWNTISISGYHIREAGSTAVQEMAFTLANGIAYVQAAIDAGLDVDKFAPQLSFFFNAHNNLLEEIAKYRAARRLWARTMKERFGAKDPKSWRLRFHTQTAGSTLTAQQPENNVARVTIQALAAVFGGTQSLHTNSMDEALWLPTEKSVRVALRTQQIIAHESGVADSVDPLAGSYLIEHLTDEIEKRAEEYISKIDEMGGALNSIEGGYMQREIQNAAYDAQKAIEREEEIVVGVNKFQVDEEMTLERLAVDPTIELSQRAKLAELRENRDEKKVAELRVRIESAAKGTENLMPLFIEAVEHDMTLGEIANILREVWGEYVAEGF
ncbi:MAG: methylmalonyl-CoA mutase family protein [Anaerolineae bacterium]|jgi:methylmalonyl-CoA mutase N-terminal domain/subunit|nr:methylmalonyl-CoA mutase family protein [Anaerolineae bacterium]MBT6063123.1 methylmalonyl-CoA mutase family protein [Anaerolineae bacterium]MBT6321754.1 methylmalonyl-CoA mutase family protein [Anaerolineae bacterium]MBT6813063.1 methylmalonyl-CoA mutase family protein [Anaerolineae bacterium]MBT7015847.1 methylmalonyl-CoA mutase family protein [Anaerolineae bacterium]